MTKTEQIRQQIYTLEVGLKNLARALSGMPIDPKYQQDLLARRDRWLEELEVLSDQAKADQEATEDDKGATGPVWQEGCTGEAMESTSQEITGAVA